MTRKTNFAFDERVIDKYNHQRKHPDDVARQIGEAITALSPDINPILEIGIGTGRIAHPVTVHGGQVIGFDLSPHMLGEVSSTTPPQITGSLDLARANMHHIPFANDSFGMVMATHVLHLADDWQQVLKEMARVIRPDGIFVQGSDWVDPRSVFGALRHQVRMEAVRLDPSMMPPAAGISKGDYLAQLGGTQSEDVVAAEWTTYMSPNERLEQYEQRLDNESWIFTEEFFAKIMTHLRQFASEKWHDLDEQLPVNRRFMLKVVRGNWSVNNG